MDTTPNASQGAHKNTSAVLWLFIIVYSIITIVNRALPDAIPRIAFTLLCIFLPFFFAIIHGWRRYGWKNIIFFAVSCIVISNAIENLGVATGFPFGSYYYSDNLGAKIFLVPYSIGFAYFATGYLAWILAQALLGVVSPILKRINIFFVPIIASFIMVSWDFTFDPYSSTLNGDWVWTKGGGFFGVPLVNFLGWYLTVFVFYQLWAYVISKQQQTFFDKIPVQNKAFWYQAALFYFLLGIDNIFVLLVSKDSIITDPTGKQWHLMDMLESLALTTIYTMFFISILSAIRIKQNDKIG